MAVVYAEELFDGRGGSADKDGRAKYVRRWEVRTDDPLDGPKVASSASAIPARGMPYVTPHEVDYNALALDAEAEQHPDTPTLWYVTVRYDSVWEWPSGKQPTETTVPPPPGVPPPPPAPDPGQQSENPLQRPPVWRGSFQTTQKPATRTTAGDPILNSAGLPFDPPAMIDVSYPVLTLTKNVAALSLAALGVWQDAVNNAAWRGFGARMVRITGIEFSSQLENGLAFWQITWQFSIKYPDWDLRPLNVGYTEKITDGAGTRWRKIVDKEGREPTEPVPLKADGSRAGPGDPVILAPGAPFQVYQGLDFSTIY